MSQERTGTTTPTPASTAPVGTGSTDMTARIPNTSGVGGTTKIADSVVSRIAALATREVPGVHDLTATGLAQAFGGFAGRMTGQASVDQGVAVQVGEVESIVNLNIVVDYEASVPQVADAIRRNVSSRIGAMTGLQTKEININVADLYFADQDQQQQQQPTVR
jgi:uncharacterized alkaline shock family protein YloU